MYVHVYIWLIKHKNKLEFRITHNYLCGTFNIVMVVMVQAHLPPISEHIHTLPYSKSCVKKHLIHDSLDTAGIFCDVNLKRKWQTGFVKNYNL